VVLELLDIVVSLQFGESGAEEAHKGHAIGVRHCLLHRGHRGDNGAHRGGLARLLLED